MGGRSQAARMRCAAGLGPVSPRRRARQGLAAAKAANEHDQGAGALTVGVLATFWLFIAKEIVSACSWKAGRSA